MKNNQEYAYNAQEKLKAETDKKSKEITQLKTDYEQRISALEIENQNLKKLLDKVHTSEEDKGNEVKMVRANLMEEIYRVQNIHQRNEDELRKDNDMLAMKYSEGIQGFKDTLKKAEADNKVNSYFKFLYRFILVEL